MTTPPEHVDRLIQQALSADESALAELFSGYRPRLKRMVKLRLDRRLRGRVDASDVLQEAYIAMAQRLPDYAGDPKVPFFLWLRLITGQCMIDLHRKHLGAAKRNADMEVSLYRKALPQASTEFLASQLLGQYTSATQRVVRAEMQLKLQETLNSMDPLDREVIALRHFEDLNNKETAQVLEISTAAASKRYIRALRRLKQALSSIPGMLD